MNEEESEICDPEYDVFRIFSSLRSKRFSAGGPRSLTTELPTDSTLNSWKVSHRWNPKPKQSSHNQTDSCGKSLALAQHSTQMFWTYQNCDNDSRWNHYNKKARVAHSRIALESERNKKNALKTGGSYKLGVIVKRMRSKKLTDELMHEALYSDSTSSSRSGMIS